MSMYISDQAIDDESTASEQDEEEEEEEEHADLTPCDVKSESEDGDAANQPTEREVQRESVSDDDSSTDDSSSSSSDEEEEEEEEKPVITGEAEALGASIRRPSSTEDSSSSSSDEEEDENPVITGEAEAEAEAPGASEAPSLTATSSSNSGREESSVNTPRPFLPQKSPNKRVRTESLAVGGDATNTRPAKRLKEHGSSHKRYVDIYNQEIQDLAGAQLHHQDDIPSLPASQIGFTIWTAAEKEVFFRALARFGKHNTPAIAARLQTKTQFEVAEYIHLLETASTKLAKSANQDDLEASPLPCDIPAAMEISKYCCEALERAADRLAVRQENLEQEVERARWGNGTGKGSTSTWLITKADIATIEKMQEELRKKQEPQPEAGLIYESDGDNSPTAPTPKPTASTKAAQTNKNKDDQKLLKSIELFKVKNWIELSERVFMNSFPEKDGLNNWITMPTTLLEEDNKAGTPAIRATALEDFYSLVVSITRRIVAAVVYVSGSRVAAKGELRTRAMKNMVWREDVDAAVASLELGGSKEWAEFWGRAPRRLGLDVVRSEAIPPARAGDKLGEKVKGVLGFDEVEGELLPLMVGLGGFGEGDRRRSPPEEEDIDMEESATEEEEEEESEAEEEDEEERQVRNEVEEADEAVRPFKIHPRIRDLIRQRIRAAREQEGYADRVDLVASEEEERRLWGVLGRSTSRSASASGGSSADVEMQEGEDDGEASASGSRPPPPPKAVETSVEELYEDFCAGAGGDVGGDSLVDLAVRQKWEFDWMDEKKNRGEWDRIRAGVSWGRNMRP